jgi:hypothetical protein
MKTDFFRRVECWVGGACLLAADFSAPARGSSPVVQHHNALEAEILYRNIFTIMNRLLKSPCKFIVSGTEFIIMLEAFGILVIGTGY